MLIFRVFFSTSIVAVIWTIISCEDLKISVIVSQMKDYEATARSNLLTAENFLETANGEIVMQGSSFIPNVRKCIA